MIDISSEKGMSNLTQVETEKIAESEATLSMQAC